MVVVMLGAAPEREDVVQRPREVVPRVRVDGLEESQADPDVHGHDVEVVRDARVKDGPAERAEAENEHLDGVGVLCCEAEGRAVRVMELVDVLVQDTVVEGLVSDVVPCVLDDKEVEELQARRLPVWEGDLVGAHAEILCQWVEQPDLGDLDGEVREEQVLRARPLLSGGGDLVLCAGRVSRSAGDEKNAQAVISIYGNRE